MWTNWLAALMWCLDSFDAARCLVYPLLPGAHSHND